MSINTHSTIKEIREYILNSSEIQTKYQIIKKNKNKRIGGTWKFHELYFKIPSFNGEIEYEFHATWSTRNEVQTIRQPNTTPVITLSKKATDEEKKAIYGENYYEFYKKI